MGFIELSLLALGLAMDAFAVSVCLGLGMEKVTLKKALTVGLYFGLFQAVMPLLGYLVASLLTNRMEAAAGVETYAAWVAFALLLLLGLKMITGAIRKHKEQAEPTEPSLGPKKMLPLAIATSIDAFVVGVTLAFLKVSILPAVALIGLVTLSLAMAGVRLGHMFGLKLKPKAEIAGGIVLILMGAKILLEHLGVIGF